MASKCAKIIFLPDLLSKSADEVVGSLVRVTGRVVFVDGVTRICQIEDQRCHLVVDLSLADMGGVAVDDLWQFIGDISAMDASIDERLLGLPGRFFLKATISRNVEGLDLNLFKRAVVKREAFLASINLNP
eukprot:gene6064-6678_t